jgi:exopolysaccharide biosynthesis WecB/TagA/CpsF family protein
MKHMVVQSDIQQPPLKLMVNERRRKPRHIWFLNTAFDNINAETAKTRIAKRDPEAPFAYMVTPNVDHLVRLSRDPSFGPLYAQAWMTVCDSRVLELLADISKEKIDITTGSDLTQTLFESEIDPDEPLTIIGGDSEMVDGLKIRYGLKNVNSHCPPMGLRHKPDAIAECAQFVADHPARFVFLCVGSPQQEMVAEACLNHGECTGVGLCVGAALEFLSGKAKRAPIWMRHWRLEWLHRLFEAPKRMWRRYLIDGPKVLYLWMQWREASSKLRAFEDEMMRLRR